MTRFGAFASRRSVRTGIGQGKHLAVSEPTVTSIHKPFELREFETAFNPIAEHNTSIIQSALASYSTASTVGDIAKQFSDLQLHTADFRKQAALAGIVSVSQGAVSPFLDSTNLLSTIASRLAGARGYLTLTSGIADRFLATNTAAMSQVAGDYTKFATGYSLAATTTLPRFD